MAKCPRCGKEIDHLNTIVDERSHYSYFGDGRWEQGDSIEFDNQEWACPQCEKTIDIEDADTFLEGNQEISTLADNQAELHRIGQLGVTLVKEHGIAKGRIMPYNHPFDIVNSGQTADEVKTRKLNGNGSKDIKIGMADSSFARKLTWASNHKTKRSRLIIVLIDENEELVAFYVGKLKQHARPSALEKVE